jgi:hypothetical protein
MSDPLRQGPSPASPGPSPMGPQGPGQNPMRAAESFLNPADLAMKSQRGEMRPDMSVREFLSGMGVDVDGPVSQLADKLRGQVKNATTPGKMETMASMAPQGAPAAPQGMGALMGGPNGGQSNGSRRY